MDGPFFAVTSHQSQRHLAKCLREGLIYLSAIMGQFGYRKLLYYKDFPGMSKPVFMVSVCSSVKIKGRDCGTINGHDESSSIRALMKDAREVLVR